MRGLHTHSLTHSLAHLQYCRVNGVVIRSILYSVKRLHSARPPRDTALSSDTLQGFLSVCLHREWLKNFLGCLPVVIEQGVARTPYPAVAILVDIRSASPCLSFLTLQELQPGLWGRKHAIPKWQMTCHRCQTHGLKTSASPQLGAIINIKLSPTPERMRLAWSTVQYLTHTNTKRSAYRSVILPKLLEQGTTKRPILDWSPTWSEYPTFIQLTA